VLAQLGEFERAINDYCVMTGETFSDRLRCGIATASLSPGPLRDHMIMHVERLATWANLRAELEQIACVQQLGLYGHSPMELGGVGDESVDAIKGCGKGMNRRPEARRHDEDQLSQMREVWAHGPSAAGGYPVKKRGGRARKLRNASGGVIPEYGDKLLVDQAKNEKGGSGGLPRQVLRASDCDVHKNLLAVADLVDTGHEVVLRKVDPFVMHMAAGKKTNMRRKGKAFEVDFRLVPFVEATNTLAQVDKYLSSITSRQLA
jgi:hypothetical protein